MILLVEDNPDDEALTLRALRKNQLRGEVRIARDGREALRQIDDSVPRLVLLDLKLPFLDGLQVLEAIRQNPRARHVPVVVLTSSGESNDILAAYERGANSYIQKPVDFVQFVDTARKLGEYWLEINQGPPTLQPSTGTT